MTTIFRPIALLAFLLLPPLGAEESPEDAVIREQLWSQAVPLASFTGEPLHEVVETLLDLASASDPTGPRLPLAFDPRIDRNQPIKLKLTNIPLHNSLANAAGHAGAVLQVRQGKIRVIPKGSGPSTTDFIIQSTIPVTGLPHPEGERVVVQAKIKVAHPERFLPARLQLKTRFFNRTTDGEIVPGVGAARRIQTIPLPRGGNILEVTEEYILPHTAKANGRDYFGYRFELRYEGILYYVVGVPHELQGRSQP